MSEGEYSASQLRKILQTLFPHRRLVLSQFTFFNHIGVITPTGETYKRGRRCYRLTDILSVACVLALKEEGIPLKNINQVPELIRARAGEIFEQGSSLRLSGFGQTVFLQDLTTTQNDTALDAFLNEPDQTLLYWNYDVGLLARKLKEVTQGESKVSFEVLQAA